MCRFEVDDGRPFGPEWDMARRNVRAMIRRIKGEIDNGIA